MNLGTIANIRLVSQQIADPALKRVQDIVGRMGAMQAQDYEMAKWAIGLRLPDASAALVEQAVNKGDIIRTHVLRVTWHLVSAEDVYWMLQLTGPNLISSLKTRHEGMGLSERMFSRSRAIMEKALEGGKHLTREELVTLFRKAGIPVREYRDAHLLGRAEMEGIICSGATKEGKRTFALLHERVRARKQLTQEEALAKLAQRYFTSHAPATLQDFIWWSGLPVGLARSGLESVKKDLIRAKVGLREYWLPGDFRTLPAGNGSAYVLPAYDEFLISYRDRSASLPPEHLKKTVSSNGIFRPVIVVGGKVVGLWSRTTANDKFVIDVKLFKKLGGSTMKSLKSAFAAYTQFNGKRSHVLREL